MVKSASDIWRDYATAGVPASGAHEPVKSEIREWGAAIERLHFATVAALVAYDASSTADGTRAYVDEYYSGVGHGGGLFIWDASSTETSDGGLIIGSGTGRWKRPEAAGAGPYRLSWWGIGGGSATDISAFKAAVAALYQSECTKLDCEGLKLEPNGPIEIDNNNTNIGSGILARSKVIANLNLRAVSGSWATGDAVLYIHGDDSVSNLRDFTLVDSFIGVNDLVDYGLALSGYYHVNITRLKVRDFLAAGIYSSREYADSTGNHGLILDDCDVLNGFGEDVGTGILLEDGDVVVKGGYVSWCGTGIKSLRGGCVIEGVHLSLADSSTGNSKVGIDIVSPRQVTISTCDFDGCGVAFRNDEDDATGVATEGWYGLTVVNNDFGFAGLTMAQDAVVAFLTETADTVITGLTVLGNELGSGATPLLDFATTGSGTWDTDFEAIVNNAPSSSGLSVGSTPSGVGVLGSIGNSTLKLNGSTGAAELRSTGSVAALSLRDSSGSAGTLPQIRSQSGIHLTLRAGSNNDVQVRGDTGTFRPNADNTQNLGGASNRWATVYAGTGTINTSDAREKAWRGPLDEAEIRVARRLAREVGIYRWHHAVTAKGDAARLHIGVTAQAVAAAFAAEGLDGFRYGVLCHDAWGDEAAEVDERGVETAPARAAGERSGIRYSQLWAWVAAGIDARLADLEASARR